MPTVFHLHSLKPLRRSSKDRKGSSDCSYDRPVRFARLMSGRVRRITCLLIVLILPIWPGGLSLPRHETKTHAAVDLAGEPLGYLPLVLRSIAWVAGDTQSAQAREDKLEDRLAQVAHVRITPDRFVTYIGQSLMFDAIGTNFASQTIPGLVFNWQSSDPSVQIDDTGRATFVGPGMTTISCTAGSVVATARVLVRPGRRPIQTDAEWRADQESLPAAEGGGSIGALLPSLLDRLAPTAYAQGGGYAGTDFGYDQLWSEPRNLVGSPRNRVIEPTQLGPVLPEGSNFNFSVPLIALAGC